MKAMIFAAGKGTRLKPLTDYTPKALVEINGIPLLELVIKKLISSGVKEIIINVHHLADQIINFLKRNNNFGIRIEISDESNHLLDTGGGLKKASWFFDDNQPFILHNTDIVSNINLNHLIGYHESKKALATLAIRNRISNRYFLFNDNYELCGWKNIKTEKEIITKKSNQLNEYAFSGIHIINPEIFKYFQSEERFSIINTYMDLSKIKTISGYQHNKNYWFDIGTQEKLSEAEDHLNSIKK